MAVDVEVNLKITRENFKAEKEEKLDILIKKTEEMMQKITMKVECFVQNNHDTSISQKEKVDIREQNPSNSIYHRPEDRFMEQYVEKKSPDLMRIFDDITSFDDLPKYDQYDDDYVSQIQINLTEESKANLGNKEI